MKIVFDVDGTLIDQNGEPRSKIVNLLSMFYILGWDIYVHSAGGIEYAKFQVGRLNLHDDIKVYFEKKGNSTIEYDIAVDDDVKEREFFEMKQGFYINAKYFLIV